MLKILFLLWITVGIGCTIGGLSLMLLSLASLVGSKNWRRGEGISFTSFAVVGILMLTVALISFIWWFSFI